MSEMWGETRSWIEKAQMGDPEAFGLLVARYEERVRAQIRPRLGSRLARKVDVDDIAQEAFLEAFRQIRGFEWKGEAAFVSWLSVIARRALHRELRRLTCEKRDMDLEESLGDLPEDEDPAGDGITPSKILRRSERFERLQKALGELEEEYRRVIFLAHFRRLPTREIAARIGRSPNAASKLLLRAHLKLRELFGDTGSLGLGDGHVEVPESYGTGGAG